MGCVLLVVSAQVPKDHALTTRNAVSNFNTVALLALANVRGTAQILTKNAATLAQIHEAILSVAAEAILNLPDFRVATKEVSVETLALR